MKTPGGALVFEVGYHPCKKFTKLGLFMGEKCAKLDKRVCFWSY